MHRRLFSNGRPATSWTVIVIAAAVGAFAPARSAVALITGAEGNAPVTDPGWPKGASQIFNHPGRIAWWEGPPFGGGQWHAECRGNAKELSAVLADFARLDVEKKRIVVHDDVGRSFWLNPNRDPAKVAAAEIDWVFVVWQPDRWKRLRELPSDLNPTNPADAGPPAQIDVYTGGNLRWSNVAVPKEVEVVDQRLEAHGFTKAETKQPLPGQVKLERVEPQTKGGYRYTAVASASADARGRWVLKNAPAGWHRIVLQAEGYVSRVAGYLQNDGQPRWSVFDAGLAPSAEVTGHVSDEEGKPLAEVEVRLANVAVAELGRYEAPHEFTTKTGADGNFRLTSVPAGSATIRLHKKGYCRPGLGHAVSTPAKDIVLGMLKSAGVEVTVDFGSKVRPAAYIVEIEPSDGAAVGKWSGSGHIDSANQIRFDDIPPGRYVLQGHPNPTSEDQRTKPLLVELTGGETRKITIPAN
jgi:hypothetical protein